MMSLSFFSTSVVLNNHIINIHTPDGQKPYQCRFCPKGFAVKPHLREHEYIHTNEKPYKCEHCDAAFNASANRNAHVNTVHKGLKREKRDKNKGQPIKME